MRILKELDGLVSSKINVLKTLVTIFKLETQLAGLAVYPLLLNVGMLLSVFMSTWFSINILLGYITYWALENLALAIIVVILINLGMLYGLLKFLRLNLKKMSFEQTRKYFSAKEGDDDSHRERIDSKACADEREIALSPNEGAGS